jgi:hypothetical protein
MDAKRNLNVSHVRRVDGTLFAVHRFIGTFTNRLM